MGMEQWKTDGSSAGTTLVKDIRGGARSSNLQALTNVNGTLFFSAHDGTTGQELWRSDGSSGGTTLVKDIRPRSQGDTRPSFLTNVNGTLFFAASQGSEVSELWRSDGSSAGTTLVKTFVRRNGGAFAGPVTNVNGTFYFTVRDDTHGRELWQSDGSSAGATLVKDIYPGSNSSEPTELTDVGGMLYFVANDGIHGNELWRSDGTSAGTILVQDINPYSPGTSYFADQDPRSLTNVNGRLFFSAMDGAHGRELWRSDASGVGATLVKDIDPGSDWSDPGLLTNTNGTLIFAASHLALGSEPWILREANDESLDTILNRGRNSRSRVEAMDWSFFGAPLIFSPSSFRSWNQTANSTVDLSAATLEVVDEDTVRLNLRSVPFTDGHYTVELPKTTSGLAKTYTVPFNVLSADGTGDLSVNFLDFGQLSGNFGREVGPLGQGDFDGNGTVNFLDFGMLSANFGASVTAPLLDFGDAPAGKSFPTSLAENGPRHIIHGPFLGARVDGEPDGQPNTTATGDGADEDGVTFGVLQPGNTSTGVTVVAGIPSGTAMLNAWIDFNADGDWCDAGEQIFVDKAISNGTNNLRIAVPSSATVGSKSARFRNTKTGGYSFVGLAPNGEVEDYQVTVVADFVSMIGPLVADSRNRLHPGTGSVTGTSLPKPRSVEFKFARGLVPSIGTSAHGSQSTRTPRIPCVSNIA